MAEKLILVNPHKIKRNPDNPRLIFHQEELEALQESIATQGILVPLTVYREGSVYRLLDGERRWRCALKLGFGSVPVIIQPKPERLQNIMMMFAIHKARRDWDPLPTALKLQDLEKLFAKQHKRNPTETELAELSSSRRGVVRRLKKLLMLPEQYRDMLLEELKKPRAQQVITVDHVIETTKGVEALLKRGVIDQKEEDKLRKEIIKKFRQEVIKNTVAPRKLATIARGVHRKDIPLARAKQVCQRLISDPKFGIDEAYELLAKRVEFEHQLQTLAERTLAGITELTESGLEPQLQLKTMLEALSKAIKEALKG